MGEQIDFKELIDGIKFHSYFPITKYYRSIYEKTQIDLHHTVSGNGVQGDINWWIKSLFRIATAFIIARDGVIHQLFNSAYWAYHLGVKDATLSALGITNVSAKGLNRNSIGIELDSWGGLLPVGASLFYPAKWDKERKIYVPNNKCKPLTKDSVIEYQEPYRGFTFYERYTDAQLASLYELLRYLTVRNDIPRQYNENMFEMNIEALSGAPGIWSHSSHRDDKSDVHPQPELIETLKRLESAT